MTTVKTITTHEFEIRQLVDAQQRAICSKDVDQIISRYADAIVILDGKPPFQTKGFDPSKTQAGFTFNP
ncbi:MAG TPA: hypothetical protein V6C65_34870 [Allocoleopsis sp.]